MDNMVIARVKLWDVIDSVLNQLTLKQCATILADIDTDEIAYLWVKHEELDSKQILKIVLQRRIGVVST